MNDLSFFTFASICYFSIGVLVGLIKLPFNYRALRSLQDLVEHDLKRGGEIKVMQVLLLTSFVQTLIWPASLWSKPQIYTSEKFRAEIDSNGSIVLLTKD